MKSKKVILIILLIVALVVVGVALFLGLRDVSQRNALVDEINSLTTDNIDEKINVIVSKGEYATVEKLVKQDYKSYYDLVTKYKENCDNAINMKVLNIENYKNDGPEFSSSLDKLNALKDDNANIVASLKDLADDTKIEEKATTNGLDGRYKELYKSTIKDINLSKGVDTILETDTKVSKYLTSVIDVLTYMKDNKSEWFIENDTLKSKSQEFIDNYNQKTSEANIEL